MQKVCKINMAHKKANEWQNQKNLNTLRLRET